MSALIVLQLFLGCESTLFTPVEQLTIADEVSLQKDQIAFIYRYIEAAELDKVNIECRTNEKRGVLVGLVANDLWADGIGLISNDIILRYQGIDIYGVSSVEVAEKKLVKGDEVVMEILRKCNYIMLKGAYK